MSSPKRSKYLKLTQQYYYETIIKNDPEYVAKRNEYSNAYYALMSQDREWMDARNKKQRAYSKEWRADKKIAKLEKRIEEFKKQLEMEKLSELIIEDDGKQTDHDALPTTTETTK
jgi:hypothetical protein